MWKNIETISQPLARFIGSGIFNRRLSALAEH
jgi:hypothetical protein